jgi:hypothetical protein
MLCSGRQFDLPDLSLELQSPQVLPPQLLLGNFGTVPFGLLFARPNAIILARASTRRPAARKNSASAGRASATLSVFLGLRSVQ